MQCCFHNVAGVGPVYKTQADSPILWDATNSVALSPGLLSQFFDGNVGTIGCSTERIAVPCGSNGLVFNPFGNGFIVNGQAIGSGSSVASKLFDASLIYTLAWSVQLRDLGVVAGHSYDASCGLFID